MGMEQGTWGQGDWVNKQADALTAASNQNLQQNIMPGIGQGAQQAGMYGSSRQGVAQGIAAGNSQTGLNSALGNLYSTAYGQDQSAYLQGRGLDNQATANANQATANANNYALGNKQADNSYNLGLGSQNLQGQNQMQNFYTQNRNLDQQGLQLGANLFGTGNQGNLGIGSGQYNLGKQYQDAPLNSIKDYSGVISPYSGINSSVSNTQGGGAQGALGGALAGGQLWKNIGGGGGINNGQGYFNSSNYMTEQ